MQGLDTHMLQHVISFLPVRDLRSLALCDSRMAAAVMRAADALPGLRAWREFRRDPLRFVARVYEYWGDLGQDDDAELEALYSAESSLWFEGNRALGWAAIKTQRRLLHSRVETLAYTPHTLDDMPTGEMQRTLLVLGRVDVDGTWMNFCSTLMVGRDAKVEYEAFRLSIG